jgi:DNA-binding transcriptional LysR family regulator
MNLRQLEVFQAVMHGGSTKNAARLLRISQPAVSNMVRQFEDQLELRLFERISGRLRPTSEAEILSRKLEHVFSSVDAVHELVNDLRDSQVGTLKILASPSLGQSVLPKAIATFVHDRPEVKIGFDTPPHETIISHLDSHQADFGLTITPVDHPAIECEALRTGRLVAAIPKGHPLAKKKVLRARDLRPHTLISYSRISPIGLIVDDAFRESGETQQMSVEVRFCFTACTLANAGVGVAVVDEFTVGLNTFENLEIRPFKTDQRVTVSLSHSRNRPLSRLAGIFIEDYLWPSLGGRPGFLAATPNNQ